MEEISQSQWNLTNETFQFYEFFFPKRLNFNWNENLAITMLSVSADTGNPLKFEKGSQDFIIIIENA